LVPFCRPPYTLLTNRQMAEIARLGHGAAGTPAAGDLVSPSDRLVLRGFDPDETYGRLGLYAVGEYRHTLVTVSEIATPVFSWLERVQGVLFAGGGTNSWPDGCDGLFARERLYSEVGYGLRFHTLVFGIAQTY